MARRLPPPDLVGSGLVPSYFGEELAQTEEDYGQQIAELLAGEKSLFRDMGFRGSIGAGGTPNFEVDPTANFGHYQQLLRNIGGQLGRSRSESIGRGLGKSGLAKARQNLIRFLAEGDKSSLMGGFMRSAADINRRRGQAATGKARAQSGVRGRALDWWSQYGPDDPDPFVTANAGDQSQDVGPGSPTANYRFGSIGDPNLSISPEVAAAAGVPMNLNEIGLDPYEELRMRAQGTRRTQAY